MNINYYNDIVELFKVYHPHLARDIDEWRPRGESGIRVTMRDGTRYDFYASSKTVRRVDERPKCDHNNLTEESWRAMFADRLREKMIVKGYNQHVLAEYSGISKGSINKYVKGEATPTGYTLAKLAQVFDCDVSELLN